jgi:hypothetical protein
MNRLAMCVLLGVTMIAGCATNERAAVAVKPDYSTLDFKGNGHTQDTFSLAVAAAAKLLGVCESRTEGHGRLRREQRPDDPGRREGGRFVPAEACGRDGEGSCGSEVRGSWGAKRSGRYGG